MNIGVECNISELMPAFSLKLSLQNTKPFLFISFGRNDTFLLSVYQRQVCHQLLGMQQSQSHAG